MNGQPLWETRVIEGDPIQVARRRLIPVVKVRSIVRRRVTFGTQASNGDGGGLVWLQPVAVIEHRSDGNQEQIPITDQTWTTIKGMLISILALPVLYLTVACMAFLWRQRLAKERT